VVVPCLTTLPYLTTTTSTDPASLFSLSFTHTHTSYRTYLPPLSLIYLASFDSFSFTSPSTSPLFVSLLARLGRATIFSFPTPASNPIPLGYPLELISPYYKRLGQILSGHAFIRDPAHCIQAPSVVGCHHGTAAECKFTPNAPRLPSFRDIRFSFYLTRAGAFPCSCLMPLA
jgi:hypothetical protein